MNTRDAGIARRRWSHGTRQLVCTLVLVALSPGVALAETELHGEVGVELRVFARDRGQRPLDRTNTSMYAQLELFQQLDGGRHRIEVIPFARVDQRDHDRSHADLRELSYKLLETDYELTVGVSRVFWGVTESKHLVNVINQVDLVENLDRERYLGQPMVRAALLSDIGTLELFAMSVFRRRTFPGPNGRPRLPLPLADEAEYQSNLGRFHPDVAARYSHFFGPLDLGVAYFYGTSRDPDLIPTEADRGPELVAHYPLIHQASLDAQLIVGGFLWKLEAFGRAQGRDRDSLFAVTGGFEYTLVGLFGSRADLGLMAEYNWDERDPFNAGFLEDDLFVGFRLALNDAEDTELVAGTALDSERGSVLVTAEADHRLSQALTISAQTFLFARVPNGAPERVARRDSYAQLLLTGYL
ncbi:MAG: hypothetical protein OXU20_20180 [Myxococcales bacterium]|nr:hypothetical protein [Myxococcales bacterium]